MPSFKALRLVFSSPLTVVDRSPITSISGNTNALKLSLVLAAMELVLHSADLDFLSRSSISIYMASPLREFSNSAANATCLTYLNMTDMPGSRTPFISRKPRSQFIIALLTRFSSPRRLPVPKSPCVAECVINAEPFDKIFPQILKSTRPRKLKTRILPFVPLKTIFEVRAFEAAFLDCHESSPLWHSTPVQGYYATTPPPAFAQVFARPSVPAQAGLGFITTTWTSSHDVGRRHRGKHMSCSDKYSIKLTKSAGPTILEDVTPPESPLVTPVGGKARESRAKCDYFDDEKYLLSMGIDTKTIMPDPPSGTQDATGLSGNTEMYFPYSVFRVA